ncbi:hypothetical protein PMAYCL1PPCAC_09022, partial [Pristionchus mayeri]
INLILFVTAHCSISTAIRCYLGDNAPESSWFKVEYDCPDWYSSEYCLTYLKADNSTWLGCANADLCDESKLGCARDPDIDDGSQVCCCRGDLCNDDPDVPFPTTTSPPTASTSSEYITVTENTEPTTVSTESETTTLVNTVNN